jgi:sugar phosphate isomerase/epimerase
MFLLSTASLAWYGLHKIFLLAKEAQYDWLDLSVDFEQFDTMDVLYIKSLEEQNELQIHSVTAPERKLTKRNFTQLLALASELEVGIVNVHPPHRFEKERDWFGDYLKLMTQKYPNITINVINAPPKTWLFLISEFGDARPETIKKITEHTALSILNVDPGSGVDLMKTFVLLGSTMWLIYLSDKTEESSGLFPGEWSMPLESLLIKLSDIQYPGHFTLSVLPKYLEAGNDKKVVDRLVEAKRYLWKYYKKTWA